MGVGLSMFGPWGMAADMGIDTFGKISDAFGQRKTGQATGNQPMGGSGALGSGLNLGQLGNMALGQGTAGLVGLGGDFLQKGLSQLFEADTQQAQKSYENDYFGNLKRGLALGRNNAAGDLGATAAAHATDKLRSFQASPQITSEYNRALQDAANLRSNAMFTGNKMFDTANRQAGRLANTSMNQVAQMNGPASAITKAGGAVMGGLNDMFGNIGLQAGQMFGSGAAGAADITGRAGQNYYNQRGQQFKTDVEPWLVNTKDFNAGGVTQGSYDAKQNATWMPSDVTDPFTSNLTSLVNNRSGYDQFGNIVRNQFG